ncbi:hypothetical protein TRVA0_055S00232 [Trichomonascus vanleenenianus]|uniref:uncharacterized protein n=1 Tax=Trichomonascus vanleenenianus TaxID=2268995 RepID=UPI003ECB46C8
MGQIQSRVVDPPKKKQVMIQALAAEVRRGFSLRKKSSFSDRKKRRSTFMTTDDLDSTYNYDIFDANVTTDQIRRHQHRHHSRNNSTYTCSTMSSTEVF